MNLSQNTPLLDDDGVFQVVVPVIARVWNEPLDAVILPAVVILPPLAAPVAVRDDAAIAPTAVMLLAFSEDEDVMVGCFRTGYIINISLVVYVLCGEVVINN